MLGAQGGQRAFELGLAGLNDGSAGTAARAAQRQLSGQHGGGEIAAEAGARPCGVEQARRVAAKDEIFGVAEHRCGKIGVLVQPVEPGFHPGVGP